MTESRTDLDSHADQCAIDRNALLVHNFDRPINVSGYNPNGPLAKDLRTVAAALAYDDAVTGQTVILIVNQAIYIPDLTHNLLSTMQLQLTDVQVNDVPRFLTEQPTEHTHLLVIPIKNSDMPYVIPFTIKGVASTFPTRKPTREEYNELPHLVLTSDSPDYDPHDPTYAEQEDALLKHVSDTGGRIGANPPSTNRLCVVYNTINSELDGIGASLQGISVTFDDEELSRALESAVAIQVVKTSGPGRQFEAEHIERNWGIDILAARRTVKATTQRGIRTLLHPSLTRRFRTNDRQLRYRQLPIDCFTDTLESNTVSSRNNKYAQIFATPEGWTRAYPMRKKNEAHEGLSLLFQREGVPNTLIMDNSKEQLLGNFRRKC